MSVEPDIVTVLQQRTRVLTAQDAFCPVTKDELNALEDALPCTRRFWTADGCFTTGPYGWKFKVMDA